MNQWHPDKFSAKKENLHKRAEVIRALRDWFEGQDYLEVETPILQNSPGMEVHVKAFQTVLISADQQSTQQMYLHTSPEFAMKKLLVAGLPKIFQICKCFRNAEGSSTHSPEFTMLEFYHVGIDYRELMEEVFNIIRKVGKVASSFPEGGVFRYRGKKADPYQEWEIITVCEAFQKYADLDLEKVLGDFDGFVKAASEIGIEAHEGDNWEDLFFRVFSEKIESQLGAPVPTIIYDYPIEMGALAQAKESDPRFAERFELYICGLELANAFGELTDAVEQRKRFEQAMAEKQSLYGESWPVEEDFLAALGQGMPAVSGIALGLDRLVMLVTGVENIEDVLALA